VEKKQHFIQIPTPGDHYSFSTGSAVMTLVYEFSRKHARHGGETTVIVGSGTRHDYTAGRCSEINFGEYPTKRQKALDIAFGALGQPRKYINRFYSPAKAEISPGSQSCIFLQNAPAPGKMFKVHAPKAKVVLHAHNSLFGTYTARELRTVVDAFDVVIFNCEFLANEIKGRLSSGQLCKVKVVYNGVDTERFVPNANLVDPELVTILFVARMVPEKGADILLKAALKIYGKNRKFKVRIVGNQGFSAGGPLSKYEVELRKIAAPMGDAVEFIPFLDRNRILPIYQAAGIFCAPSNWNEPCTLTIPEAMACGAPTIASRRGGIPEMAGDAALYFDPSNIDELADQLAYLIDDGAARLKWSGNARKRALQCDWANRYADLLKAIGE